MEKDTYFFVEGKSDEKFLSAILLEHFSDGDRAEFVLLGGDYKRLSENVRISQLREGKKNLIVLDADKPDYSKPAKEIADLLSAVTVQEETAGRDFLSDVFLFPDNRNAGNLEDLVRELAPENKKEIWECIDRYANCIEGLGIGSLRNVDKKTKVFIYVNAHDQIKWDGKDWLLNHDIWDLKSKALNPLLEFIENHFTRKA